MGARSPSSVKRKVRPRLSKSTKIQPVATADNIVIPAEPIEPLEYPEQYSILLYGTWKIGKSTFASKFHDPLFISTEPGLKFLRVRKVEVRDWETYLALLKMLESGKHEAGMLVVDTVDNLFKFCFSYVCETEGFDHPADEGFGKGWEAIYDEWFKGVMRLDNLGVGVMFISHEAQRDVESRGLKITKTMPNLPKTGMRVIGSLVDTILRIGTESVVSKKTKKRTEVRFLYTRGKEDLEAGGRLEHLPPRMLFSFEEFRKYFKQAPA